MGLASSGAIFLHCLPAHRNEEVTDAAVLDGARSRIWVQAANRMHAARGAIAPDAGELAWLAQENSELWRKAQRCSTEPISQRRMLEEHAVTSQGS